MSKNEKPHRAEGVVPAHVQAGFDVRCEWGLRGIEALAPTSDVVVVVDVLSFTTCVEVATANGATVLPYRFKDDTASAFAARSRALLASSRDGRGYSLSPASLRQIPDRDASRAALAERRNDLAGCTRTAVARRLPAQRDGCCSRRCRCRRARHGHSLRREMARRQPAPRA